MNRGASVRNGPKPMPAKLNLEKARPNDRYERSSPDEAQRPRPARAASAAAPPTRGASTREPPRRRRDEEEDAYPDDVYDMYSNSGSYRNSRGTRSNRGGGQARYIEEEPDEDSDYEASFDEGEFEIVSNRRPGGGSVRNSGARGSSRRPELRNIRVKVHAASDVRYIMIGTATEFVDFEDRIKAKFGIRRRMKIKIRDDDAPPGEGDMITMGDQDDLEMAIQTAKQNARKQRLDTGKMEVSF